MGQHISNIDKPMRALPSIRQLEVFVAVAKTESFSRAAEMTHMSQSALSQAILEAEKTLGTKLFERSKRSVRLSRAGRTFLQRVEQVLANLHSAVAEAREDANPAKGRVAISCLALVAARVLPTTIQEFRSRYPEAFVTVRDDFMEDRVAECLMRGEADLAVSALPKPDDNISFQPLFEEKFYFIAPLKHPLASRKRIAWSDLADVDYVGLPTTSSNRMLVDRARTEAGTLRETIYQVGRVTSVVEIVAQGGGVSVVPALALSDRALREQVRSVLITGPTVERTIGIMQLRGQPLSATASEFQRLLVSTIGRRELEQVPGLKVVGSG